MEAAVLACQSKLVVAAMFPQDFCFFWGFFAFCFCTCCEFQGLSIASVRPLSSETGAQVEGKVTRAPSKLKNNVDGALVITTHKE